MTTLAAFPVPLPLVRLLERHDPSRADHVRRLCAGPPPDTVLVLGADDLAVGRLAAALAARVPGLVRCAPAGQAGVRTSRLAETRAVVWVFSSDTASAPTPAAHWALLAELAGQVDEVHLALAGRAELVPGPGDPAARIGAVRARLAREVPRLADAPVHPLAVTADALVDALTHPDEHPGYRNALRVLTAGLAEAAERRADRYRNAALRERATEAALGRRADELTARRRELTGEGARRSRAELAALRVAMSQRLDEARRGLRDQARDHLERADRVARARFPALFAAAVTDLVEGLLAEFDAWLADRFDGRMDPPTGPSEAVGAVPVITPPSRAGRSALEDRLMLLVGGSSGLGLGRLLLAPMAAELSPAAGRWTLPLAVGLGVASACWLARARHAAADRARLLRWAGEVLADARAAVESGLAERALGADRRLAVPADRAAAEAADDLRDHDRLARRVAARRAELAAADRAERDELDTALGRLTRLLEVDGPARRTERAS